MVTDKRQKIKYLSYYRFTLLELLVVISIMIILTSILLPALKRAREAVKRSVCLGNLKQVSCAIHVYSIDNNDYLPQRTIYWNGGDAIGGWLLTIGPDTTHGGLKYLPTYSIIYCPTTVHLWTNFYNRRLLRVPSDVYGTAFPDYGINAGFSLQKLTRIKNPSGKLLLGDSIYEYWNNVGYMCVARNGKALSSVLLLHDRHNNGANIAWLDGHVNWNKNTQETFQLQSNPSQINYYFDVE